MKLHARTAIITGASLPNGIGYATAKAFAAEGASLALTGTNESALQARADEIVAGGGRAIAFKHDVTDESSWAALFARAVATFGRIDILVNNAGLTIRHPIDRYPLEDWQRVIGVNLTGVFLGCKLALGTMRHQGGGGAIVNVSSIAATKAILQSGAYGSSKAGVRQLTRIVALEGAPDGIRCNAVYPGLTETDFIKEAREDRVHMDALVASLPFGRMGTAAEVANCIFFLASDDARYVSGADLVVDGALAVR